MRFLIVARNRTVAVDNGEIVEPEGRFDMVLELADAEVRPGLINAHDHLHRNHYGRLGRPPYQNAYDWAYDIQARYEQEIADRRGPRRDALLAGAWKNLFAGVTTVVHHDPWELDFEHDFPLRVAHVRNADSLGMTPELDGLEGDGPFCLHLAEGTGDGAADEVRVLADMGLLTSDLIAVHGVGVDEAGAAQFRVAGAALVWCPTSNFFLFEKTAPPELLGDGVDVLLGSDSLLTAAGDLLDELRFARNCGVVSDERLESAVGAVAARRFGLPEPSLEPGSPADLVVLARPILDARAQDVLLVVAGGVPRVAHPGLVPDLNGIIAGAEEMTIGSVTRWTSNYSPTAPIGRSLQ